MTDEIGTLAVGEIHPAAPSAMRWVKNYILTHRNIAMLIESLASCALSGNRTAEVCGETLRRIMHGENVSDRYLLGLSWMLREMEQEE